MSAHTKTALVLLGTLVIGVVLGALLSGTLAQQRRDRSAELRGPRGFVQHMERVIQPTSDEQWAEVLPILQEADDRNRALIRDAETEIAAALQELGEQLGPLLDERQLERLTSELDRARPLRRPPPRGGPPPPGGGRDRPPPRGGRPPGGN